MTVSEWLAARTLPPPPALRDRLRQALGTEALGVESGPEVYLRAAERLVGALLRGSCAPRESALDLLTADALVTYAFEAAGEAPAGLAERATAAIRQIASLGAADREGAMA